MFNCAATCPPDNIWLLLSVPRHCPGSALRRSDWPAPLRWTTHMSSRSPNWPTLRQTDTNKHRSEKLSVRQPFGESHADETWRRTSGCSCLLFVWFLPPPPPKHQHFLLVHYTFSHTFSLERCPSHEIPGLKNQAWTRVCVREKERERIWLTEVIFWLYTLNHHILTLLLTLSV